MKKTILSLMIAGAAAFNAHAGLVLNEPFTYEDGFLTAVSSGLWSVSTGTGEINVISGKANLSQLNGEDLYAALSGSPHSTGNLYASFVVNFSTLPSSSGTYFAHFKDAASGFRTRLFARTTGAPTGQFRFGIANGSAISAIEKDLDLNTDYVVVLRYDTVANISTVWINPGSESATSDRADASDSTPMAVSAFALRQAGGMGILTLDDLKVGTSFDDVASGDSSANPPVISNIPDQSIPANSSTAAIEFTVNDGETAPENLVLIRSSANQTLVPNPNIVLGGSGTDRTITVTPAAGQQGTTEITVTVFDANNNTAERTFSITVGAPAISAIANQTTPVDTTSATIPFTVSDNESAASTLVVTAVSSNEEVVPSANIVLGGSGSNRTATITPASGAANVANITLTVSDGINSTSTTFVMTVFPLLGLDLFEEFDYADGSLVANSSFIWDNSSGTDEQMQVLGGKVLLTGSQSEDVNTFLMKAPYDTNSGAILYSSFEVNFSELPTASAYFAHFRDTGSGFRAKVWSTTDGAAEGSFRLGISNGANSFDPWETDLSLGTTYTVVTRYNVGTGESKMWVNPTSEASAGVAGTDSTFVTWIQTYGLRQASGMGSMSVDNLKIGTAFSDVFDASALPPTLNVSANGGSIQISWTTADSAYVLQSVGTINGTWGTASETPVQDGDTYTVTINSASGNQFYRLVKP